ncbi:YcjX family GTP-binding protein [Oceanomicrobium pacificus]|uniref:YcjX family protein n=1 Tax=Oceanomicrobium pacificus TaxID=2692916 RepID=A0A6B0TTH0_9RHOB|nr:YcjX family protein [Oceanomicrobium pacificus]MXU64273.1 YcjX family protein [Oceanomicrobium pacificus]
MVLGRVTDQIVRVIEDAQGGVEELLFEPVIRLGVTGLSRAGKTVFITSLVANLIDRGRMPHLSAASSGRIEAAFLQPQPDDDVPRFDYETHLRDLTGKAPRWPESTRAVSQLRLSLRVRPRGMLSGLTGARTVHLDIVDYPGEWLLDLPLLDQSFADWSASARALALSPGRADHAADWIAVDATADGSQPLDEAQAQILAARFRDYLRESRAAGFSACAPGRFLLPGDLDGSPALTFAPLAPLDRARSGTLYREFERRFEAYKKIVVKPFFRNHFARIDRQIVLIDALGAVHDGPQAVNDLAEAMQDILACFRPGRSSWLASILGQRRADRILFAATKADLLHHSQHPRLTRITEALVREARARADFKGARTAALSLASLRATVEQTVTHDGAQLDCVRGILEEEGTPAAMFAGDLPEDPAHLLTPAGQGADSWLDQDFTLMRFAPPVLTLPPDMGPPHIRLDRAAEFLLGDKL